MDKSFKRDDKGAALSGRGSYRNRYCSGSGVDVDQRIGRALRFELGAIERIVVMIDKFKWMRGSSDNLLFAVSRLDCSKVGMQLKYKLPSLLDESMAYKVYD